MLVRGPVIGADFVHVSVKCSDVLGFCAACGALAVLLCASVTGLAVVFGGLWAYCAAKLAMAVPIGILYSLGYSPNAPCFPRRAAAPWRPNGLAMAGDV